MNEVEGDKLIGVWEPGHGKAKVKITKVGNKYYGKIVWLKFPTYDDGSKKVDKNNPDSKMHSTPLLGYKILHFHQRFYRRQLLFLKLLKSLPELNQI
jgi:hypothetical protein